MTQRAIRFEADLDISDVTRGLNRIEQHARRAGGTVGRVGGGLGRAGGGIGRTVGAGAGIGAGLAVFELAFEKIFELFENTPVLTTFIEALDSIFKAAGPLVGILLDTLTPIIKALAPAIEPLARALAPLIELLGAGLLIVIQAITPAIILFAEGLEKVTTFIRDTVLKVFRFIVDQLNKLPFIDIQVELDKTGDSFDAMAVQIESAGNAAGGAGGGSDGGATGQFKALEQRIRDTTEATGGLSRLELRLANERALNAAASERAAEITALWTRAADENAAATGRLTQEMDEAYTANDRLGVLIGASRGPAVDLANAVDAMTMQINDAQTAADLNAAAFAALTPDLMAAAIALGIFRSEIAATGAATGSGLKPGESRDLNNPGGRSRKSGLDTGEIALRLAQAEAEGRSGIVDPYNGTIYQVGGGRFRSDLNASDSTERERARYRERYERLLQEIRVVVQIGDETVDTVTSTSENRRGSE